MSAISSGAGALGVVLAIIGAAAWGLATFFLASSFVSTTAGGLLGSGVFVSALAYLMSTRMQESRMRSLLRDACPQCQTALHLEHEHQRWDTEHERWLVPVTTWECAAYGYGHAESTPCDRCPEAAQ